MYKLNIKKYDGNFDKDKKRLDELIKKRINGNISKEEFNELKELNTKIFSYVNETRNKLISIFSKPLKDVVGHGQDNIVYNYTNNWIIKIMVKRKYEGYGNLKEYFQYKYKLLRKFLKNYIPDTYFLEGETINSEDINYNNLSNYKVKYTTIYTVQRKIKGYTLNDIPINIRKKGRLLEQLKELHEKYIKLKLYIHYIEYQKYGIIGKLKFKMDIGKISNQFNINDDILMSYKTPNIMYDIEKDKLFLIDFDTGNLDKETKEIFNTVLGTDIEEIDKIGEDILKKIKKKYKKLSPKNLEKFFKNYNLT